MARIDTLTNFLTDVAAAIKAKKGDNTAIPAANFDTEIANLPSGETDTGVLKSLIDRTAMSIEIPKGTTSIGGYAFYYCTSLTSITIPDSVTGIGEAAFYYCGNLTSITIPDGVTSIGSSAFSGCTGLTSIIIPDGVTSIGGSAFSDCTGLTQINWNAESVSNLDSNIFSNAGTAGDGIEVIFGNNVKSIPAHMFYAPNSSYIPNIKFVTIGNSVTSIGNYAFSGCTSLTSITLPNSVMSIGNSAFSSCSGLTSITFPDSVTSIGGYAFYGCSGLTSITIPDGVTSIGDSMFRECTNLTEIDFSTHNAVPTLADTRAFYNTSASLVIKVPSVLLDEWKAATNWATYADKIVGV